MKDVRPAVIDTSVAAGDDRGWAGAYLDYLDKDQHRKDFKTQNLENLQNIRMLIMTLRNC